jgi:hypothetical protein
VRIVSNASPPLVNLARIGKLDLLRELYGKLLIPEAVWREVVVDGAGQPGGQMKSKVPTGLRGEQLRTSNLCRFYPVRKPRCLQRG